MVLCNYIGEGKKKKHKLAQFRNSLKAICFCFLLAYFLLICVREENTLEGFTCKMSLYIQENDEINRAMVD